MSSSPPQPPARQSPRRLSLRTGLIGAGAVLVIAVLVIAALTRTPGSDSAEPSTGNSPQSTSPTPKATGSSTGDSKVPDLARRVPKDPMAIGRVDAPVVMVEYADFRCPFCGVFARQTKPELMRFVNDGTLRIEFRDMPVFGTQSTYAAIAGRAAAAQGHFWQYYDAVYAEAPKRGHADLTITELERLGRKAKVPDMATYTDAIKNEKYLDKVNADQSEGSQIGVTATPAFLINNTPILGAQPTDVFVQTVEKEARQ